MKPTIEAALSLERIRAAYERSGLNPLRGHARSSDAACAVVAVTGFSSPGAVAEHFGYATGEPGTPERQEFELFERQVIDFIDGWDGHSWDGRRSDRRAFTHGRKMAIAIFAGQ